MLRMLRTNPIFTELYIAARSSNIIKILHAKPLLLKGTIRNTAQVHISYLKQMTTLEDPHQFSSLST
jgi:hypothetical protein